MRKQVLFTMLLGIWGVSLYAQRYAKPIFNQAKVTQDVIYGEAMAWDSDTTLLLLDVYEPAGDTLDNRPLIVLAHGGFFMAGNKQDLLMQNMARYYARCGYVVASINYRLGINRENLFGIEDEFIKASGRAMQDMRMAVRYLYSDVDRGSNAYGIDTNYIFLSGYSAGAMTALHAAYYTDDGRAGSHIRNNINTIGGIDNFVDNDAYSVPVHGVSSIGGAILDTVLIIPNSPVPMLLFHGDQDRIFPYHEGFFSFSGVNIAYVYGSERIYEHAYQAGIYGELLTFPGGGHDFNAYLGMDSIQSETTCFFYNLMHNQYKKPLSITSEKDIIMHPISTNQTELLHIRLPDEWMSEQISLIVLDGTGQQYKFYPQLDQETDLETKGWPSGTYLLKFRKGSQVKVRRLYLP